MKKQHRDRTVTRVFGRRIPAVLLSLMLLAAASCGNSAGGAEGSPAESPEVTESKESSAGGAEASLAESPTVMDSEERGADEESSADSVQKTDSIETEYAPDSLVAFCDDPAVRDFFDRLEEDTPVQLEYWIYGEGPVNMTFTEPELILSAAKALTTVTIGGVSEENPDLVCDASGEGYYFTMADGSSMGFSFEMGCFRWNGSEWHRVSGFGDLRQVGPMLSAIGNPEYRYIYADDDGFYTRYLECYETEWVSEENMPGGIVIHTGGSDTVPCVFISRCSGDETEPRRYLRRILAGPLSEMLEESGYTLKESGTPYEETIRKKELLCVECALTDEDENELQMRLAVLKTKDSMLGREALVQFGMIRPEGDGAAEEKCARAFEDAVAEFYFKHAYYEQQDVVPGTKGVISFINDELVTEWYERALENPPEELVYMADTWYVVTEPDDVAAVLKALQTVTIGGESSLHIGGADRQIFDFYDEKTDDPPSFMFFGPTFDWDGKSYDVLDWGDLGDLDVKSMASYSAGS